MIGEYSLYGSVKGELSKIAPEVLGKPIIYQHYVDANLYHDILTGCSVTRILHFINQTHIALWSNKQATAKTATYSSELVAARIFMEQIVDMRTTLRYLELPILVPSQIFGDDEPVVNSCMKFHSKLLK